MPAKPERQLICDLICVVNTPLREVVNIYSDRTEATDTNLPGWANPVFDVERGTGICNRPAVRHTW